MPVEGLDKPCGTCRRVSGDHTLREWAVCMGEVTTDLPYEEGPADAAKVVADSMRERFGLDPKLIIADHFIARAAVLEGSSGAIGVKVPTLLHEFQMGVAGQAPVTVAEIAYIGDPAAMRQYGKLLRDTANGAANAAERR